LILLVPVGEIDGVLLKSLCRSIAGTFQEEVAVGTGIPLPVESWNRRREQYNAEIILSSVPMPPHGARVLAVVGVDLFSRGLNYVFGTAQQAGRKAVVSVWRLRQELYYLPRDDSLLRKRTLTEAVHELGHTYGLGHCASASCVMGFSQSISETDLKGWKLCRSCREALLRIAGSPKGLDQLPKTDGAPRYQSHTPLSGHQHSPSRRGISRPVISMSRLPVSSSPTAGEA
jgi:archaemetzincin